VAIAEPALVTPGMKERLQTNLILLLVLVFHPAVCSSALLQTRQFATGNQRIRDGQEVVGLGPSLRLWARLMAHQAIVGEVE
jgi:hypothetical protein